MDRLLAFVVMVILLPTGAMFLLLCYVPSWLAMWAGAGMMFFSSKVLAVRAGLAEGCLDGWREIGHFVFLWPGMDPTAFRRDGVVRRSSRSDVTADVSRPYAMPRAILCATFGIVLIAIAGRPSPWSNILRGWIGMIGTVFVIHFGLFDLLTVWNENRGFECPRLMNQPLRSDSVADFWSRRWNRPYRELIYRFVFIPLRELRRDNFRLSAEWSLAGGFFVSGILHDAIISIPAGAGYGLPTCYFILQAGAMLAERKQPIRSWRANNRRLWTFAILLLPLPLLFHPPFVVDVMLPFFEAVSTYLWTFRR